LKGEKPRPALAICRHFGKGENDCFGGPVLFGAGRVKNGQFVKIMFLSKCFKLAFPKYAFFWLEINFSFTKKQNVVIIAFAEK
jgi:hypothetical protein